MEFVKVEIQGTTPLLMNKFGDEAAMKATTGNRASAVGERGTPREQAEKKLYIATDGKTLMIPQPNLFRAVIDGGVFFKAGKSKVTTQKSSLIPACLTIPGIEIPLIHNEPWEVDTRAVRIPSTGGRILCYRPCLNDWKLQFEMELDTDIMTMNLLREIVDAAGKRIGLGDFRPACKGPFGKFVVTKWDLEKRELKVA
jgi:hypothetical protein